MIFGKQHVLVAAASSRLRERLRRVFRDAGHEVVDKASGKQAMDTISSTQPALVAIDFRLSDMWGYEFCHRLREGFGDSIPLVLLSSEERGEPYDRVAALLIGADECFVKPFDDSELLVHAERLMSRARPPAGTELEVELTPRELEVLRLIAYGRTPAVIAREFHISRRTVDTHVQNILRKLDVHSRSEAVALAYRFGIVPTEMPDAAGDR